MRRRTKIDITMGLNTVDIVAGSSVEALRAVVERETPAILPFYDTFISDLQALYTDEVNYPNSIPWLTKDLFDAHFHGWKERLVSPEVVIAEIYPAEGHAIYNVGLRMWRREPADSGNTYERSATRRHDRLFHLAFWVDDKVVEADLVGEEGAYFLNTIEDEVPYVSIGVSTTVVPEEGGKTGDFDAYAAGVAAVVGVEHA